MRPQYSMPKLAVTHRAWEQDGKGEQRQDCLQSTEKCIADYYTLGYEAPTLNSLLISLRILLTVSFNYERYIFEGRKLETNIFSTVLREEALETYQDSLLCIPTPVSHSKFSELFGTYFSHHSKYNPADALTVTLRSLCLACCRMISLSTK